MYAFSLSKLDQVEKKEKKQMESMKKAIIQSSRNIVPPTSSRNLEGFAPGSSEGSGTQAQYI